MRPAKRQYRQFGGLNLRQCPATTGLLCKGQVNGRIQSAQASLKARLSLQPENLGGEAKMAHASLPSQTSRDRLAEARVRFLTADAVDSNAVRKPILASWWRSRQWRVAADHIDLSYLHEPDLETRLVRSAEPVLRRLREQLDGQPIS